MGTGQRVTYIAATDTRPIDLHEDVVRGFELGDGSLFVFDFEWSFEYEREILRLAITGVSSVNSSTIF